MESANKSLEFLLAVATVVATAVLVWFGNSLTPWWPLMWLAPLPMFWFALRARWWAAGLVAFAGWLAGSANLLAYFHVLGAPFAVWLANFGALSFSVAVGVLIFRRLVLRGALWIGIIAPAALWVSLDWARYWWSPHGTGADLAYTQLEFLPFLQLASITGPWGMTFLLQVVPAAAAVALHLHHSAPQRALRVAGTVAGVMLLVLGYGALRLIDTGERDRIKVGLIAADTDGIPAEAVPLLKRYATQVGNLATRGAQIVVIPEKTIALRDADAPVDDAILQSVADSTGTTLVAGELQLSGARKYNRAKVYSPRAAVASYDKEHMLPPFESDLTPGTEKLSLRRGTTRLGVAICKDMDFTSMSVAYANLGTQLMLVPAWDFNSDRTWHGHMAIMRGVEGGFAVARAAKNGYLTLSDDRGRIVAEARSDLAPFATVLADVPVGHEHTLFQKWGNWFAWVAVAALVAALVQLTAGRKLP